MTDTYGVGDYVKGEWVLGRHHNARVADAKNTNEGVRYLVEFVDPDENEWRNTRYWRRPTQLTPIDPLPRPIEAGSIWFDHDHDHDSEFRGKFAVSRVSVLEDGAVDLRLEYVDGPTVGVDLESFVERVVLGEIEPQTEV